jgi:hypothetical protein
VAEAKAKISDENVKSNTPLAFSDIIEALDILRGAVSIVYPMGLPDYDPIRMEFENREELTGATMGAATLFSMTLSIMKHDADSCIFLMALIKWD